MTCPKALPWAGMEPPRWGFGGRRADRSVRSFLLTELLSYGIQGLRPLAMMMAAAMPRTAQVIQTAEGLAP